VTLPILVLNAEGEEGGAFVWTIEVAIILATILTGMRLIAIERGIRYGIKMEVQDLILRETDIETLAAIRDSCSYKLDWIVPFMGVSLREKGGKLFTAVGKATAKAFRWNTVQGR
jgi:hypothetical protein